MPTRGTRPLPGTRYFAAKFLTLHAVKYSPGDEVPVELVEGRLRGFSLVSTRKVIEIQPDRKLEPWQARILQRAGKLDDSGQLRPVQTPGGDGAEGKTNRTPRASTAKAPAKKTAKRAAKKTAKKASPRKRAAKKAAVAAGG